MLPPGSSSSSLPLAASLTALSPALALPCCPPVLAPAAPRSLAYLWRCLRRTPCLPTIAPLQWFIGHLDRCPLARWSCPPFPSSHTSVLRTECGARAKTHSCWPYAYAYAPLPSGHHAVFPAHSFSLVSRSSSRLASPLSSSLPPCHPPLSRTTNANEAHFKSLGWHAAEGITHCTLAALTALAASVQSD